MDRFVNEKSLLEQTTKSNVMLERNRGTVGTTVIRMTRILLEIPVSYRDSSVCDGVRSRSMPRRHVGPQPPDCSPAPKSVP